jgi:hypothetical protein
MRFMPFGVVAGLFFAVVCNVACGQISAQEGKWVVAHGADIQSKCTDYIKTKYGDSRGESAGDSTEESAGKSTGESAFENAELVRIVTTAPSSWEFYSRDRGILIAIDAGPDVSLATRSSGTFKIARAAEAVIRQERDMAIADRVMVIFIDHAVREIGMRQPLYRPIYSPSFESGSHLVGGYGAHPIEIAPPGGSAGFSNGQTCGCRW